MSDVDVKRFGVWATPKSDLATACWHTETLPTVTYSMAEAVEMAQKAYANNDHWTFEPRELPPAIRGMTPGLAAETTYDGWSEIHKRLQARIGELELALGEAEAQRDAFGQKAHQLQQAMDDAKVTPIVEALAEMRRAIDVLREEMVGGRSEVVSR